MSRVKGGHKRRVVVQVTLQDGITTLEDKAVYTRARINKMAACLLDQSDQSIIAIVTKTDVRHVM